MLRVSNTPRFSLSSFSFKSTQVLVWGSQHITYASTPPQDAFYNPYLFLNFLLLFSFVVVSCGGRKRKGEKKRRNKISKKGGRRGRKEIKSKKKKDPSPSFWAFPHGEATGFQNNLRMDILIIGALSSINCWVIILAQ